MVENPAMQAIVDNPVEAITEHPITPAIVLNPINQEIMESCH